MLLGMRNGLAASPVVSAIFAAASNDWTTVNSTSTMPTGGSISRAGNAMLYDSTGKLTYAPNNVWLQNNTFATSPWYLGGGTALVSNTNNAASAPDGTTTAGVLVTGAGSATWTQNVTSNGGDYIVSVWARVPSGTATMTLGMGGASGSLSVTTTWQRFSFRQAAFTAGTQQVSINLTSANTTYQLWGSQLEVVTYQTSPSGTYYLNYPTPNTTSAYYGPRFDYDPRPSLTGTASIAGSAVTLPAIFNDGTPASSIDSAYVGQTITVGGTGYPVTAYVGSTRIATVTGTPTSGSQSFTLTNPGYLLNRGLLVEGTRTNVQPYSNGFNSWTAGAAQKASFNLVSTTQPDGTATGYVLIEDSTAGIHQGLYGSYNRNSSSVLTYTATVYAKSSTRRLNFQVLDGSQTSGAYVTYDLAGGQVGVAAAVFGTYTNPIATMQNVGGGWYRCRLTFTSNVSASFFTYFFLDNATGTAAASTSYTGNGTSGVNVFGVQIEEGAFPTSYIPVPAASTAPTNTRSPDAFTLTGYANRLVEAFYIDEETGANYSGNSALSTGTVTISPPTFGWVTSLRAYTNAYAGSISTPSWLSFSGTTGTTAGNRTYYDSTGTLTFAPANLAQQSGDVSAAFWASGFDAGNTTTSSSINFTSASGYRLAPVSTGIAAGQTYIFSCVMSSGTKSTANLRLYDNGGGAGANVNVTLTSTPTRYSVIWTTANSPTAIYFGWDNRTAAGGDGVTGSFNVSQMQLERVTYQTAPSAYIPTTSAAVYGPRYDFDPSTVPATPRGLLIEEQRANLVTRSQQFEDGVWQNATPNFPTVSANTSDTSAPDGTNTADKVTASTGGTTSHLRQQVSGTLSGQFATTFFVKNGNSAQSRIRLFDNGLATVGNALINWSGSSIASLTSVTGTADYTSVGNGWYRIWVITASLPSNASLFPSFYPDSSAGTGFVYLWGAQLEAGSFATSYIPSITGATRAPDVAQLTGSALTTAGAATGTAIIETGAFQGAAVQASILASNQSNRRIIYNANSTTSGSYDGTNIISTTISNVTTTTLRQALGWGATTGSIVINNGTLVSGALSLGTNATVYLGATLGGTNQPNTWFRSMALYNQKLPDAILKQKSSVGAPY